MKQRELEQSHAHSQWLQNELESARASAIDSDANVELLKSQLSERAIALEVKQRELEQSHAHSQWLENELNVSKNSTHDANSRADQALRLARKLEIRLHQFEDRIVIADNYIKDLKLKLEKKVDELEVKRNELERAYDHSEWLQNEWDAAKVQIQDINGHSHHWFLVSENLRSELHSVYRSRSWLITAPLRQVTRVVRGIFLSAFCWITFKPESLPRKVVQITLSRLILAALRRPKIKAVFVFILKYFPRLYARLQKFHAARLAQSTLSINAFSKDTEQITLDINAEDTRNYPLNRRATKIYMNLQLAVERLQQGYGS